MASTIISGVGASLPDKVLTNADLEKIVDTSDEWIITRTGIKERRILQKDEKISDHCIRAAKEALENAGIKPDDLDLIINATFTGDSILPAAACIIQEKLGVTKYVPAFDLAAACSGWVYGLEVANNFIKSGNYSNILLIGADALTPITNWKDRGTCVLFGDGAGAAVITKSINGNGGILATDIGAVGKHADLLRVEGGGSFLPASRLISNASLEDKYYLYMAGNELFKIVTRLVINSVKRLLEKAKMSIDEIDLVIPHQANIRIIEYVCKNLSIPMEKIGITLDKYGNCSAGTVPITLYDSLQKKKIKNGDNIVFTAFGGGLTFASVLMQWTD
jgi:3-oxoacyl-[acyl-carrier-protein] synthase-3